MNSPAAVIPFTFSSHRIPSSSSLPSPPARFQQSGTPPSRLCPGRGKALDPVRSLVESSSCIHLGSSSPVSSVGPCSPASCTTGTETSGSRGSPQQPEIAYTSPLRLAFQAALRGSPRPRPAHHPGHPGQHAWCHKDPLYLTPLKQMMTGLYVLPTVTTTQCDCFIEFPYSC